MIDCCSATIIYASDLKIILKRKQTTLAFLRRPFARNLEKLLKRQSEQLTASMVSVMGHVDHGKTSLLDVIRKTNVMPLKQMVLRNILVHIKSCTLQKGERKAITFLDTRACSVYSYACGAKATDIAILVVAADEGVMPQTEKKPLMCKMPAFNHCCH